MHRQTISNSLTIPRRSTLEDYTLKFLYSTLEAWRTDLHDNLTEEEWSEACCLAQSESINTNSKLLQYKWISRLYM